MNFAQICQNYSFCFLWLFDTSVITDFGPEINKKVKGVLFRTQNLIKRNIVMILSFRTNRPVQTADPDQTAQNEGAVWSGSTLFVIPSASLGLITL